MKKVLSILLFLSATIGAMGQGHVFSTSNEVDTRLILLPPYSLDFRNLINQPGNQIIVHNLSGSHKHISLNFGLNSTDASVGITIKKPVLSIELAPNASQVIPLSELGEFITQNNLTCSGVSFQEIATNKTLPDGYYSLCVTPLDFVTNGFVGKEACSSVFPIMALEPPMLRLTNATLNDTVLTIEPQNLLFQWNLPSSLGARNMAGVKTTLKVVEVPNGMTPTQAILSAPIHIPAFDATGEHLFVYGPTVSPLIKGRRYVAVVQMTDPNGKVIFRNNGTSEVLTFVFGRPEYNPLQTLSTIIKGSVQWAYKAVEETKTIENIPLVDNKGITESNQAIVKDNKVGSVKYPLEGALIEVFGADDDGRGGAKVAIATAKSDALGQYSLSLILKQAMQKFKYITIEVSHPSSLFSKVVRTYEYDNLVDGSVLDPVVLAGQTLELTPRVLLKDGTLNNQVNINILMPEAQWNKYSLLADAGLGIAKGAVKYNNQSYTVVATLTNGNKFKRLFQTINPNDNYVVQVNYPNRPSAYYPLDGSFQEAWDGLGQKPVVEIAKNFVYDNTNQLSGKVLYQGKGELDVRIAANFEPSDVLGTYGASKTFTAITDNDGNYTITGLPNLRQGAVVKFTLVDRTLSNYPFNEQLTVNKSGNLTKDFTIQVNKIIVRGQLTNKDATPIQNALVLVNNSNKSTHTDDAGNYSIELEQSELSGELKFLADGFESITIPVQISKSAKINQRKSKPIVYAKGAIIERGTTTLSYFTSTSTVLINVIRLTDKSKIRSGTLTISPLSGVWASTKINLSTAEEAGYLLKVGNNLNSEGYKATFTPSVKDEKILSATSFKVSLATNRKNVPIVFGIVPTEVINGIIVNDSSTGAPIAQQLIKATVGDSIYEAISDKSGRFQLVVPVNKSVLIQGSRPGFLSYDSTFTGTSDTVVFRSSISQTFNSLLGFPAKVTFLSTSGLNYIISGYIKLNNNNVFSLTSSSNLYFNQVIVSVDAKNNENAIPLGNVSFLTNSLILKAFGFATVQGTGLTLQPTSTGASTGKLCGKLVLFPTTPASSTFTLPNAVLVDKVAQSDSLHTVFALSTGNTIQNTSYRLYFNNGSYQSIPLVGNTTLNIDTATLLSVGVANLHGYMQFGTILGFTPSNSGKVSIQSGALGTNFNLNTLTFNNGNTVLTASLQKIKASFSSITIAGLATTNAYLLFGGNINITNGGINMPFTGMGLVNVSGGYAMSSSINMPSFSFKSLTFAPLSGAVASLSYSGSVNNGTYNLNAVTNLNLVVNSSNAAVNSIANSIFPSGVSIKTQFNLQTANWAVLIAVQGNLAVNLDVAKVAVGSFLLKIGKDVSINTMDSIMQSSLTASIPIVNGDTTEISDNSAYWAFGIAGSVTFPAVKSMVGVGKGAGGGGIILMANNSQGFQAKVDSLNINIQTQVMSVTASLSMEFDNLKKGFSAAASILMFNFKAADVQGFEGTLTYYSYATGGIELGASLTIHKEVETEFILWHSFGGGFGFNTGSQVYNVFVNGDFSPAGTPAIIIDEPCTLNLLFSSACNYVPIITGNCTSIVGKIFTIANSNMTLDLCHKYALINVDRPGLPPPLLSGAIPGVNSSSTLFIAAPSPSVKNGCFYYQSTTNLSIPYILPNAAVANVAVGYNANTLNPYIPASSMSLLPTFVGNGTMNGMYASANAAQSSSGNYGFNAGPFGGTLNWNESMNFAFSFSADIPTASVNLSTNFAAGINGYAGISACGFGAGLGGSCSAAFNARGAYGGNGFNLNGNGSGDLEIYGGSGSPQDIGCNSVNLSFGEACWHSFWGHTYCIPYPDGIGAKACFGLSFNFGVQSGQSPYINVNF